MGTNETIENLVLRLTVGELLDPHFIAAVYKKRGDEPPPGMRISILRRGLHQELGRVNEQTGWTYTLVEEAPEGDPFARWNVAQLLQHFPYARLINTPWLGKKTVALLAELLEMLGLHLRRSPAQSQDPTPSPHIQKILDML